jgi:hypothetical protein
MQEQLSRVKQEARTEFPVYAGIQSRSDLLWTPACAGVTKQEQRVTVIPAEAGIQSRSDLLWIPACSGVTKCDLIEGPELCHCKL